MLTSPAISSATTPIVTTKIVTTNVKAHARRTSSTPADMNALKLSLGVAAAAIAATKTSAAPAGRSASAMLSSVDERL